MNKIGVRSNTVPPTPYPYDLTIYKIIFTDINVEDCVVDVIIEVVIITEDIVEIFKNVGKARKFRNRILNFLVFFIRGFAQIGF